MEDTPARWMMRLTLDPILRHKCRTSRTYLDSIASASRVLTRKPMVAAG
jgi:hypothetical protein